MDEEANAIQQDDWDKNIKLKFALVAGYLLGRSVKEEGKFLPSAMTDVAYTLIDIVEGKLKIKKFNLRDDDYDG